MTLPKERQLSGGPRCNVENFRQPKPLSWARADNTTQTCSIWCHQVGPTCEAHRVPGSDRLIVVFMFSVPCCALVRVLCQKSMHMSA
jgi:hypothetical protein